MKIKNGEDRWSELQKATEDIINLLQGKSCTVGESKRILEMAQTIIEESTPVGIEHGKGNFENYIPLSRSFTDR